MRLFNVLILLTVLGSSLFYVKHQVHMVEEDLQSLQSELIETKESILVLKAEWSYLNRPERLEALNHKYLNMAEPTTTQIADIKLLPYLPGTSSDKELEKLYTSISYKIVGAGY